MYATDMYHRRKRAGVKTRELYQRLPPCLPNGRRIQLPTLGEIERCEREIDENAYNTIIETIDTIATERAKSAAA